VLFSLLPCGCQFHVHLHVWENSGKAAAATSQPTGIDDKQTPAEIIDELIGEYDVGNPETNRATAGQP